MGKGVKHAKYELRQEHVQEHETDVIISALKKIGFRVLRKRKFQVEVRRERPSTNILIPYTVHVGRGEFHEIAGKAGVTVAQLKDLLDEVYEEARTKR